MTGISCAHLRSEVKGCMLLFQELLVEAEPSSRRHLYGWMTRKDASHFVCFIVVPSATLSV